MASMVICKLLYLNIWHISFLIASTCLGDFVQVGSPSSLYNPTFASRSVSLDSKNSHTSWQSLCAIEAKHCYVEVRPYFAPWHVIVIMEGDTFTSCVYKKNYPFLCPHLFEKRSETFGHSIRRKKLLLSNTNQPTSTDEVSL